MRIALFTPKDEVVFFIKKVNLAVDDFIFVDQFEQVIDFLDSKQSATYDVLWVATDGAKGMEIAISLKEHISNIPLVWESEDELFAVIAYDLNIENFLLKGNNINEISKTIKQIEMKVS